MPGRLTGACQGRRTPPAGGDWDSWAGEPRVQSTQPANKTMLQTPMNKQGTRTLHTLMSITHTHTHTNATTKETHRPLEQLNALVAVVLGLDAVADAGHADAAFLHALHKLLGVPALVHGLLEVLRGAVDGAAKPRPDGQQARHQGRDQVLAGPRRHDRVVCTCRGGRGFGRVIFVGRVFAKGWRLGGGARHQVNQELPPFAREQANNQPNESLQENAQTARRAHRRRRVRGRRRARRTSR